MDEIILRDQNHVTVLAGIANDFTQEIRMLRVDPSTGAVLVSSSGGGGSGTNADISFVDNEIISGSTQTFTLAYTPISGSLELYGQRKRLYPGDDYSISGKVITTIASYSAGDLLGDYQVSTRNEVVSGSGTTFTLLSTPNSGTLQLYGQRNRLYPNIDYTLSGKIITTTLSYSTGDLLADYQSTSTPVNDEVISGSGTNFTLAATPIVGSEHIFGQGVRLYPTSDYSISGANITTILTFATGDLLADYRE